MYKYLFGPVPSRRLGMSLGVDLVPHKVCTLDCVYCECGKTTLLSTIRKEYIPAEKVYKELYHFFNHNPNPEYITFSGSGEPTLNIKIGEVLSYIKNLKPGIPVALLTNGTLLSEKDVREEVLQSDLVLPSLDAATSEAFKKINRPENSIDIARYIQGLVDFRKEFSGMIWLEILILPGYNDDPENLQELEKAINRIKPDKVQLNTLDRPGTVESLRPASVSELTAIKKILNYPETEIIAAPASRKNIRSYRKDTETAILETIFRRPCTANDLSNILGIHLNEINKYMDVLEAEGKVETRRRERGIFYQRKS